MANRRQKASLPNIAFNERRFEHEINELLRAVEGVEKDTNIMSEELLERIGSKAIWSAGKWSDAKVRWSQLRSGNPKKRFKRPVIGQGKKTKQYLTGVWYQQIADTPRPYKNRKKKRKNKVLQNFAKTRKSRRADKNAPFLVPKSIPNAAEKGLKKTKMVVYLKGKRRQGKFGMLPMGEGYSNKRLLATRNPASAKFGWSDIQRGLKAGDPRDTKAAISEGSRKNHKSKQKKHRVRRQKPTMKRGAFLSMSNMVHYGSAVASVNTRLGARKGVHMAKNWFEGYWVKRQKSAVRNWRKKHKAFS